MEILRSINTWFWNDYVWLPPNITWNHIGDTSIINYAQFSDLNAAFKVALALLALRYILDQFIFSPLGCYLGLRPKKAKIPDNTVLEKAFSENGKIGYKQVKGLAKQLDWSERRVERWIRRRISRSKPSTLSKFTESAWRFTFYLCAFCYGLYTLWDKPWLWSTNDCFYDYPHHSITDDVWWYYMLELGFYWSLAISQFMDTKRKDFLQMFVHHIVTIMLLTFSWTSNLFRIGSLVLVIHDFADVPLEAAKMAKYVESQKVADSCFAVFTIAWIISRLGLYPYRIIYYTMYEALLIVPMFPAYYVFNSLLCALQILHIVWTWMIVKIAIRAMSSKNPGVKDLRSDSEETESISSEPEIDTNAKDTSSQENSNYVKKMS
ncbi:ceramide synthase 5-like [Uloborus diversus]|uniref:ceramide synthase 5-like n=1 Tax=Uloborus diversus TaxID=327109 RepID=UPI002409EAA0|nr:ceramide synthase 5-like [Uloborus diversus]